MDPTSAAIGIGFGTIPQLVMRQVTFLSMVNTNLYTSVLGNMFLSNIMNVATARNGSVNDTSVILELESMIDDILVGIGSAQLEIAGGNSSVVNATSGIIANATIATMRVGNFQHAVTVTVLNFLVVIVYLVECVRTRGWKGMPMLDYNDIASVIVVVSRSGPEVGDAVAAAHKVNGTLWLGDARNMAGGQTRMTLGECDGMPTLQIIAVDEDSEQVCLRNEDKEYFFSTWDI
ncbi:hypothetical protein B0H13DRAFT_1860694 [Mycena leptocephala]|nr:hypothetical protein B0H13DRAFT_1860694 [Mycena leptocephala]